VATTAATNTVQHSDRDSMINNIKNQESTGGNNQPAVTKTAMPTGSDRQKCTNQPVVTKVATSHSTVTTTV